MKTIEILGLEPKRLDIALAEVLELSRSKAQKIISDGRVLVNGKETNAHELVSSASKVEIADPAAPIIDPNAKPPAPLDILYEDADVLVVNKPAGLLVHPTTASTEPTLLDLLRAHIPGLDAVGDDKARAGIVHRLDKLASGVLIAAKTPEAFTHLKAQFAQRLTEKRYTALVMGNVTDDTGIITFPIARSQSNARMAARPSSQEGKDAITHFDVLHRYASATLLDVRIETGRTHQIRVHFFALGHPVAGDELYNIRGVKQIPLGRLFLHARALTIDLPNGERKTFEAPLPPELELALTKLSEPHLQRISR